MEKKDQLFIANCNFWISLPAKDTDIIYICKKKWYVNISRFHARSKLGCNPFDWWRCASNLYGLLLVSWTCASTPLPLHLRPDSLQRRQDLDLDKELGEELISDYFKGVVWLHQVSHVATTTSKCCESPYPRLKQLKEFVNWPHSPANSGEIVPKLHLAMNVLQGPRWEYYTSIMKIENM